MNKQHRFSYLNSKYLSNRSHLLRRGWPPAILFLAGATILLTEEPAARYPAAAFILFLLPGWSLLAAFFPKFNPFPERLIVAVGISLALTTLVTLYITLLPGPNSTTQLLAVYFSFIVILQLMSWRHQDLPPLLWPSLRRSVELLFLLGLVLLLRLPMLGYAEFHEDEVEVTALAVRALQGEDFALFLHRKGPVQTLLPMAGWLLGWQITEGWARFPFALASICTTLLGYLMARRLGGPVAGIVTGVLLAINGYNIAFGRMVQYQAIVLFLGLLALFCTWQAQRRAVYRWFGLSALLLAITLLAHFDSLLYVPVILFMMAITWKHPAARRWIIFSLLLLLAILLGFYVPYVRDPQFVHTLSYLRDSRVGSGLLYNNLDTLQKLDASYSSRFYLPLLTILTLAFIINLARRRRSAWLWLISILIAIALTISRAKLWQVSDVNLAVIPWIILGGWGWFQLRQADWRLQSVWLWWLLPLGGYLFLVDDPRTHLYVAYTGWAIVAGLGAAIIWQHLPQTTGTWLKAGAAAAFFVVCGLCLIYLQLVFFQTERAFRELYNDRQNRSFKWVYRNLPEPRNYFGYPKQVGWKGVGVLYQQGIISGDFRSYGEEEFSVPIWYTFQTARSCYTDPALYLVTVPMEELESGAPAKLLEHYGHVGNIMVEDIPSIHLVQKDKELEYPKNYSLTELIPLFDDQATLENFTANAQPAQPVNAHFGQTIDFSGFTLSDTSLTPNQTLNIELYWQARQNITANYRAFLHLEQGRIWGQHDDDPACRLPTSVWRAGQTLQGQFRITVAPETPPGAYRLLLGLYDQESGERLPVTYANEAGSADSIVLTEIQIRPRLDDGD